MKKQISVLLIFVILIVSLTPFAAAETVYDYYITLGDIDNDGSVDINDARAILRIAIKIDTAGDDLVKIACDLNRDGVIDTIDARLALMTAADIKEAVRVKRSDITTIPALDGTGLFVFTTYGYGHGVGMSQWGAQYMAKAGYTYKQILLNFYTGTSLVNNKAVFPSTVTYGGNSYSLREALARVTTAEMGLSFETEAVKAQIIAAATYIYYQNRSKTSWTVSGVAFSSSAASSAMLSLVDSVIGQYVSYNSAPADTVFFAASAGKTTNSENIWYSSIPYLKAADSHWEIENGTTSRAKYYAASYQISSEDLKEILKKKYPDIKLSADPSEWLKIISHDGAVSSLVGYVSSMKVGNLTMKGNDFRTILGSVSFKSPCFSFIYKAY